MIDALQKAEKRLFRLEAVWLLGMSFGTLITIEFGFVADTFGHISDSSIISILLFLALGIYITPLTILLVLPCWNFISPIQDRITIWETEFIVFIVTCVGLTISSVYFFDISNAAAIKTQLFTGAAFLPILCLSAQYRWYVEIAEIRQQIIKPVQAVQSTFDKRG